MSIANGLFVRPFEAKMIKGNPKWLQTDCRQLTKIHFVLAENARVDTLVEVHTPLHGGTFMRASNLRPGNEAKVTYLRDHLLEARRGTNIAFHQDDLFLRPIQIVDFVDHCRSIFFTP